MGIDFEACFLKKDESARWRIASRTIELPRCALFHKYDLLDALYPPGEYVLLVPSETSEHIRQANMERRWDQGYFDYLYADVGEEFCLFVNNWDSDFQEDCLIWCCAPAQLAAGIIRFIQEQDQEIPKSFWSACNYGGVVKRALQLSFGITLLEVSQESDRHNNFFSECDFFAGDRLCYESVCASLKDIFPKRTVELVMEYFTKPVEIAVGFIGDSQIGTEIEARSAAMELEIRMENLKRNTLQDLWYAEETLAAYGCNIRAPIEYLT